MGLAAIEDAVAAIGRGEMVVVVDDEARENEGDLIVAAEFVTPDVIAFFLHHTSGVICVSITAERARELDLDAMVARNTESQRTAFLVSVDRRGHTTTGISAHDRTATILGLVDPDTKPDDLLRPGHIFPLQARDGGVLNRPVTPRPPSTSPAWPAATRPGCCARSSTRPNTAWPASPISNDSPPTMNC